MQFDNKKRNITDWNFQRIEKMRKKIHRLLSICRGNFDSLSIENGKHAKAFSSRLSLGRGILIIKAHPRCKFFVVEHFMSKLDHGYGSSH
jgi:hypothetical protein